MAEDNERSLADLNTRDTLERLLDDLGEHPERIAEITSEVERIFTERRTVLILDMSGFTRMTQQGNLISYLLMINQMKRLALPCVDQAGGILVKAEHDNLTCLFDSVNDALAAADEITDRLESANVILPKDRELYVSIGIGHGDILNVENRDIYGNEVNLASKLGEDLAGQGEILLTSSAHAEAGTSGHEFKKETVSISGITAEYYRLVK